MFDTAARGTGKVSDQTGDLAGSSVRCEMTAVENVNLSVRHVPAIGFRRGVERGLSARHSAVGG